MKTIRVEVTAADIAKGEPTNEKFCPVARALARALNRPVKVLALKWTDNMALRDCQLGWRFLPVKATRFIRRLDNRQSVKPFSFTIDLNATAIAIAENALQATASLPVVPLSELGRLRDAIEREVVRVIHDLEIPSAPNPAQPAKDQP